DLLADTEEWRLKVAEFEMIQSLHCPVDVELRAAVAAPAQQPTLMVDTVASYHGMEQSAQTIARDEIQAAVNALAAWHRVRTLMHNAQNLGNSNNNDNDGIEGLDDVPGVEVS